MLQLDLNAEEHEVLLDCLEQFVSELRSEIADTDIKDFRDMLKRRQAVLNRVIQTLRAASSSAQAA